MGTVFVDASYKSGSAGVRPPVRIAVSRTNAGQALPPRSVPLYGPSAGEQADDEQRDEDKEQDLGNSRGRDGDSAEPENGGDNCQYQKNPCVMQHLVTSALSSSNLAANQLNEGNERREIGAHRSAVADPRY